MDPRPIEDKDAVPTMDIFEMKVDNTTEEHISKVRMVVPDYIAEKRRSKLGPLRTSEIRETRFHQ